MADKMFVEMTVVEKFAAVAEALEDAEMREWVMGRAEMAARKSTSTRKADPAVVERKEKVLTYLTGMDAPVLAADVAEALEMTSGQARAALTALVKEGRVQAFAPEKGKGAKNYAIA